MTQLNSRQRLLRAIELKDVDHIPCCFMSFAILRQQVGHDRFKAVEAELEMGLDPMLFIPAAPRSVRPDHPDLRGLPLRFSPEVQTKIWREGDAINGRLFREYLTPAGRLHTSVRLSDDWPHGAHLPFIDDYQIPRADKPLITSAEELEALQYLLTSLLPDDIRAYQAESAHARDFAEQHGVLLVGGWGVGMDMVNWLCGMEELMVWTMQQPDLVGQILQMIHQWNLQRMEVVLSGPVDLYIRRAWYEGCDFVTPRFYRSHILPRLKAEVDLAHQRGTRFGYICSSGTKPMLDLYVEAGIDVLIGVDPIQGSHTNMPLMKEKLGGNVCLWGGVSAAITVEGGDEQEIRAAVGLAHDTLGPTGFILSPIDNFTVDTPQTWRNIDIFIDEWQRRRTLLGA